MMMTENVDAYDLSSLQYSTTAGEALNPDLFDFWKEHTGLTIYEGFGQTETPLTIANLTNSTPRPGSMGKPVPLYNVEIQRDDGTRCAVGETGEVCIDIHEKAAGIMLEYYRDPEKTAAAMTCGWYHTGDTAWCDEDGYFWYVGRNDDVIKSSGYRIGPFEIESVLLEHEACLLYTSRATKTILLQSDATRAYGSQLVLSTLDNHAFKTRLLLERAERYGAEVAEALTGDALELDAVVGDRAFDEVFIDAPCSGPVSYTHLDVYKRQAPRSCRSSSRTPSRC